MWLALALMLLGALAEGFGLLMIVPLATIAIQGSETGSLWAMRWLSSWPADQRLLGALALFIAAMGARSLLLYARDVLLIRLQAEYEANLQLRSATTLAGRGWPFASSIGQAGMQSLLLSDVPRAGRAVSFAQSMAVGATMLLVQLALTFLLSPGLTAVAVAFLALAFLFSTRPARRGVKSGFAINEAIDESAGSGFRLHAGLKAALAQGTVAPFIDEYRDSLCRATAQQVRFTRDYSWSRQIAAFGAALVAAVLLLVGIRVLELPFPVLIASLALFARMAAPAQQLQTSAIQVAALAPAFVAIEQRLGKLQSSAAQAKAVESLEWAHLTVDRIGVEHQAGLGLSPISFGLNRGDWLGVTGASGAGKTTLIDLVAGLLSPQAGSISIDGRPLAGETLEQWRAAIAYVGQDGIVFNDSVRRNLVAEGAKADEVDLWQALETVGLGKRVRALPAGLNESVGDRGSQLSGGERQRLVLARALLRRPSLLILDEATAALDATSEESLIGRLKALEPRPAALVVAHRESTLRHCDSVLSIQHDGVKSRGVPRSYSQCAIHMSLFFQVPTNPASVMRLQV